MTTILNKLFPFTGAKVFFINKILSACPESTRERVIAQVIAKQIPDFHIKRRPYKLHPKHKQDGSYETGMDRATKYIDKYKI